MERVEEMFEKRFKALTEEVGDILTTTDEAKLEEYRRKYDDLAREMREATNE